MTPSRRTEVTGDSPTNPSGTPRVPRGAAPWELTTVEAPARSLGGAFRRFPTGNVPTDDVGREPHWLGCGMPQGCALSPHSCNTAPPSSVWGPGPDSSWEGNFAEAVTLSSSSPRLLPSGWQPPGPLGVDLVEAADADQVGGPLATGRYGWLGSLHCLQLNSQLLYLMK